MKDKFMNILNIIAGSIVVTAPFLALILNLMMFPRFDGYLVAILVFIVSVVGSGVTIFFLNKESRTKIFNVDDIIFSLTYSTIITLIISLGVLNFNY